ncbi:MAG: Holliday junction branch migration protein RuvA [Eubacteriales bacterium]|nr:Holliday junction branch migration protein RuvA [Eubacteriales bacterium]
MYAYITGRLDYKDTESLVVEAGGVGYRILAGARTLSALPECGSTVKVYTYLQVREDAMVLFGFYTAEEKSMFQKLITVNGVGPKVGMAIISGMSVADIAIALVSNDAKAFSRVPGVGKKTAERLILELKEQMGQAELTASDGGVPSIPLGVGLEQEAVQALMALGYSSAEASKAVTAAEGDTVEARIMNALRRMDTRR